MLVIWVELRKYFTITFYEFVELLIGLNKSENCGQSLPDKTSREPLLCINLTGWFYSKYYFTKLEFDFAHIIK